MRPEKITLSAGGGALYLLGSIAATATFAGFRSIINTYVPSFKGPLNASLVIGASSMGAFTVSKFLDNKRHETLSKVTGIFIVFLTTATLTPTVSNLLSTKKVSYIGSCLYGLAGAGAFLYIKPDLENDEMDY